MHLNSKNIETWMVKPLSADCLNCGCMLNTEAFFKTRIEPDRIRPNQTGPEVHQKYSGTLLHGHPGKVAIYNIADTLFGQECIYVYLCTIKAPETLVICKADRFPSSNSTWTVKNGLRSSLKLFWERGYHIPQAVLWGEWKTLVCVQYKNRSGRVAKNWEGLKTLITWMMSGGCRVDIGGGGESAFK